MENNDLKKKKIQSVFFFSFCFFLNIEKSINTNPGIVYFLQLLSVPQKDQWVPWIVLMEGKVLCESFHYMNNSL